MDDPAATLRDGALIQRCYELAEAAVAAGNHPFGALLVRDGEVLIEAQNAVETGVDVTRHAELELVRSAWAQLDEPTRQGCVLYTSTEPCMMCAGAIYWAGVRRVVYGVAASEMAGAIGESYRGIPLRELSGTAGWNMRVTGPVLQEEGLRIHAEFWPGARSFGS